MKLYLAPLQGYTDAPFRHFHAQIYGKIDGYFSPFLRLEKGEPARRTLRDILSPLNEGLNFVPQIIFRDNDEFLRLTDALKEAGFDRIDLNMGCPFSPQVKKGRGAGFLQRIEELDKVAKTINDDTAVRYSVKMRLGVERQDEWQYVASILRNTRLEHITIHPRTAREQYKGSLHFDEFERLADVLEKPIVFNGEIHTLEDIAKIVASCPWLSGVMVGRGVLARPSLFAEWVAGEEWDEQTRLSKQLQLHDSLYAHYKPLLCGDAQLLLRIKSFWDYSELPHRSLKKILKSNRIDDYEAAVRELRR